MTLWLFGYHHAMPTNSDAAKVLAELLRERLAKSPELAAKQRRLLEMLRNPPPGAPEMPGKQEMEHQQRMADAVAAKLWPKKDAG